MSAFSAIQENREVFYSKNSSDEEDEVLEQSDIGLEQQKEETTQGESEDIDYKDDNLYNETSNNAVFSRFEIRKNENFKIFTHGTVTAEEIRRKVDKCIIIGLKLEETLVIRGQYEFELLKGAIEVEGIVYSATDGNQEKTGEQPKDQRRGDSEIDLKHRKRRNYIFAPSLHSIPEISVVDGFSDAYDSQEMGNFEFNYQEFYTVLKLRNIWDLNFSDCGEILCPIFKKLYHNNQLKEEESEDDMINFKDFTFFIILNPVYDSNLYRKVPESWKAIANKMKNEEEIDKIIIFGYKNCGKSTLLKYLLNKKMEDKDSDYDSIAVLDIDPGQLEFSKVPQSLSYTLFEKNNDSSQIIGNIFASMMNKEWREKDIRQEVEYFGSGNVMDDVEYYLKMVEKMYNKFYIGRDEMLRVPLLVNMPGWVRGYGVKVMGEIVKLIKGCKVVYMKNCSTEREGEEDELEIVLNRNSSKNVKKVEAAGCGGGQMLKYSGAEMQMFRMLTYFHVKERNKCSNGENKMFDYRAMVYRAPLRISLGDIEGAIRYISIGLDCELGRHIDDETVKSIIDCSVIGLYAVDMKEESIIQEGIDKGVIGNNGGDDQLGQLLGYKRFQRLVLEQLSVFIGLCVVHSTNWKLQCLNVYMGGSCGTKDNNIVANSSEAIRRRIASEVASAGGDPSSYCLLAVRSAGAAGVPVWEMYPRDSSEDKNKYLWDNGDAAAAGLAATINHRLPYLSRASQSSYGLGGRIGKVRRNIQRRAPSS